MKYNPDIDLPFGEVYLSVTKTCTLAYFEPETLALLKVYIGIPADDDLYLKAVYADPECIELKPSARPMGKTSGFFKACRNATSGSIQVPLEVRRLPESELFGKSETCGFLHIGDEIETSRIIIMKPKVRRPVKGLGGVAHEPVTVTRFEPPLPVRQDFTPKAMAAPTERLIGFTRITRPVVYKCNYTGEELEFESDEAAHKALTRRGHVAEFCRRNDLKFDLGTAWVKALISDDTVTF